MDANNENNKQQQPAAASGQIKLQLRSARVQKYITVDENISISNLRNKAADLFELGDPTRTVLIFGGKILKDAEDIKTHGIKDGQTIHLVIRNKPTPDNSQTSSDQPGTRATPATTATLSNPNNDSTNIPDNRQDPSAIPQSRNLDEVHQRLQQMLITNPDRFPNMRQLMNNSPTMRSLLGSMQRMQGLMERNPEVNHLLSNPDVLRESLEMVRNPAALQEVMRNYDRALNNMESMPGGHNVLRRMYTEFQEPLLNAFTEQFNTNQPSPQSTTTGNTDATNESDQQGTENRDPLPNPWATPAQPDLPQIPSIPTSIFTGSAAAQNATNPAQIGRDIGSATGLDAMFEQELLTLLLNPEAMQSIEQIQQGWERLQRITPTLCSRLGLQSIQGLGQILQMGSATRSLDLSNIGALGQQPGGAAQQADGAASGGNTGSTNASNDTNQQSADTARVLSQFMRGFQGLMRGQGSAGGLEGAGTADAAAGLADGGQPPEERYSQQLQQLNEMGFTNRQANLQALIASLGDINTAIARLLSQ